MAKTLSYFLMSLLLAVGAAACGDDESDTTTTTTTATGDGDGDGDPCPASDAVTHNKTTDACELEAPITAPLTQNLTLTADLTWVLTGPVVVGDDTAETVLTIEPGTTIYGGAARAFVLVQRGSRIEADGTAANPIVFTSAQEPGSRGAQDWGGLVINGRAPINNGDASGQAQGEVGTGTYGGNNPADNSGTLRYVRVEFAGGSIDPENELNGISFQGVGNGTTVDFIQTHITSDDGIELFGGTVNVKHVFLSGADDDSMDWTFGWSGNAQFVAVKQLPESGDNAERGIEADNNGNTNDAAPFSNPVLSNVTLLGLAGQGANGMKLRAGTKGQIWNTVVVGFDKECVDVDDVQTEANVTNGELVVQNLILDCTAGAASEGGAAALLARDGANVVSGDSKIGTDMIPQDGSPVFNMGTGPDGAFFEPVNYAGAFDGASDWRAGWIETAVN